MKKTIQLETLRSLIRKEIATAINPQQGQEIEPEQPGIDPRLAELTSNYIRKLRMTSEQFEPEDVIEMVALIVSAFGETSEQRLEILKGVKYKTVR